QHRRVRRREAERRPHRVVTTRRDLHAPIMPGSPPDTAAGARPGSTDTAARRGGPDGARLVYSDGSTANRRTPVGLLRCRLWDSLVRGAALRTAAPRRGGELGRVGPIVLLPPGRLANTRGSRGINLGMGSGLQHASPWLATAARASVPRPAVAWPAT